MSLLNGNAVSIMRQQTDDELAFYCRYVVLGKCSKSFGRNTGSRRQSERAHEYENRVECIYPLMPFLGGYKDSLL